MSDGPGPPARPPSRRSHGSLGARKPSSSPGRGDGQDHPRAAFGDCPQLHCSSIHSSASFGSARLCAVARIVRSPHNPEGFALFTSLANNAPLNKKAISLVGEMAFEFTWFESSTLRGHRPPGDAVRLGIKHLSVNQTDIHHLSCVSFPKFRPRRQVNPVYPRMRPVVKRFVPHFLYRLRESPTQGGENRHSEHSEESARDSSLRSE